MQLLARAISGIQRFATGVQNCESRGNLSTCLPSPHPTPLMQECRKLTYAAVEPLQFHFHGKPARWFAVPSLLASKEPPDCTARRRPLPSPIPRVASPHPTARPVCSPLLQPPLSTCCLAAPPSWSCTL